MRHTNVTKSQRLQKFELTNTLLIQYTNENRTTVKIQENTVCQRKLD